MAITCTHAKLFQSLSLPRGGSLLEIGEANWYGDVDPRDFGLTPQEDRFAIAKEFYAKTFAPLSIRSIDMNGTPAAFRFDLNDRRADLSDALADFGYDVVINHGTAEHIFDIANVFRIIHSACQVGGLMIHDAPFTGWIDHGFYCLQPTLFYDLAHANCYEVVMAAIHVIDSKQIIRLNGRDHAAKLATAGKLPSDAALFAALRKLVPAEFKIPTQDRYARPPE